MMHAKNYKTVFTFVEVMQKNLLPVFPDTVYNAKCIGSSRSTAV